MNWSIYQMISTHLSTHRQTFCCWSSRWNCWLGQTLCSDQYGTANVPNWQHREAPTCHLPDKRTVLHCLPDSLLFPVHRRRSWNVDPREPDVRLHVSSRNEPRPAAWPVVVYQPRYHHQRFFPNLEQSFRLIKGLESPLGKLYRIRNIPACLWHNVLQDVEKIVNKICLFFTSIPLRFIYLWVRRKVPGGPVTKDITVIWIASYDYLFNHSIVSINLEQAFRLVESIESLLWKVCVVS